LHPVPLGTGHSVRTIATGLLHTCALLDDGNVKCWGQGEGGMLGYGDTVDRGGNPADMGDQDQAAAT
jgi:E3 ubiquitin-protein ligase HERC3